MITRNHFQPFPGEQIQCAVVLPGTIPRIVMVNHSNKIFILRYENSHWKPYPVQIRLESRRGEINKVDEKMSIAAMDGAIRLFWMHGQDGEMLTIDTRQAEQGYPFQLRKITTPF